MSYPPDRERGEGPSRITSPLMEAAGPDELHEEEEDEVEQELGQVK
jgi:hypothetical protein